MDFDLESLVNVEQTFYDDGYKDGYAHGRIHGLIEGRALGREKGFEMWEEVGFYEGFAHMWSTICEKRATKEDTRIVHHTKQLLDLISQFPKVNPSSTSASDLDIPRLFRQIRSRYKVLCAALGIRPTLRVNSTSSTTSPTPDENEQETLLSETSPRDDRKKVWPTHPSRSARQGGDDLSF
ncbi:hypothetical protein QCA50_015012 [Cerrena zonata]|uniref:Essential protein Yae1 N-terminal domain-containing protein n=1 Tax=Cerrena zonata TaxID=2478898 RepID=A0AAW0FLN5_9APHY